MIHKRGQVTIFIIIALVIVVLALLVYFFLPKITTSAKFNEENPEAFLQNCVEDDLEENAKTISLRGGSLEPAHYFEYFGEKLEYLCYTSNYYETCIIERPMLKTHFENELSTSIESIANSCFESLRATYESKGYSIDNFELGNINIEILPERISLFFEDYGLTASKSDTLIFNNFKAYINSNLYDLIDIANFIILMESSIGESSNELIMRFDSSIKVETPLETSNGERVHILTHRETEDKFQFASRSLTFPAGY